MGKTAVAGIAFGKNQARINVCGVSDKPGVACQTLSTATDTNAETNMIIQNVGSKGITDFPFTIPCGDYKQTLDLLNDLKDSIGATAIDGDDIACKVSVVGTGMRSHAGVAVKIFHTLAEEGINIQTIFTSEIKISVLIDKKYMGLTTRALRKAFDLGK